MKRLLVLFVLAGTSAHAARPAPVVVENKPCTSDYAAYVARFEASRRHWITELDRDLATATGAARENLLMGKKEAEAGKPIDKADFDAVFAPGATLTCRRLVYLSEGLRVVAYAVGPRAAGKHPVLFFLRGGNGDFGKLDEATLARQFAAYARAGYLVIGPQYRGVDGGQGKDEFGGAEVADVLALPAVASVLPDADPGKLFVYGISRGGMMTYLALRRGLKVQAAVVHAGVADSRNTISVRPEMEETYQRRVPGYAQNKDAALSARSAVDWAGELTVPILILHGSADWRVDPAQALAMAGKLVAAKREVALILFAGDGHGLRQNLPEVRRQTLRWFALHGGLPER